MRFCKFFRVCFLVLLLVPMVFGQPAEPEEKVLREKVQIYFEAVQNRDLAGLRQLWLEDSPQLAGFLKQTGDLFADDETVRVENLEFFDFFYKDEVFRVRIGVRISGAAQNLTFLFVRENEVWKIWGLAASEPDLGSQLARAEDDTERDRLFTNNPHLQNSALCENLYFQMFVLRSRGEFDAADKVAGLAEKSAQNAEDKRCFGKIRIRRATVSAARGELAAASKEIFEAIEYARSVSDREIESQALYNAGLIFQTQGNLPLMEEYFSRALVIAREINFKPLVRQILHLYSLGISDPAEQMAALTEILASLREDNNLYGEAAITGNMAHLYSEMGDQEKAIEMMELAVKKFQAIDSQAELIEAFQALSHFHFVLEKYDRALEWAEKADRLALTLGQIRTGTLTTKFRVNRKLKRFPEALENARQAVALVEELRPKALSDENSQTRFLNQQAFVYQNLTLILSELNDREAALKSAELFKARVLFDIIRTGKAQPSKAMSAEERTRLAALKQTVNTANLNLIREKQREYQNKIRLADLEEKLNQARFALEEFQTRIYALKPELRIERGDFQPLRSEEISALFPDDGTAFLEFAVTEEKTFLYAITRENGKPDLQIYPLEIKREDLLARTQNFRQKLQDKDLDYKADALDLHKMLLGKAANQLRGKTALVIIPDSFLWDLPFQALLRTGDRFLIEDFEINYAPSLTVLREMNKTPGGLSESPRLLAFGNPELNPAVATRIAGELRSEKLLPLPEAEKEVDFLVQFYGADRTSIFKKSRATETAFKSVAGDFDILHFATHGVLNNENPMYSGLVLATDEQLGEDGLLEAWELLDMDLRAELAVLSACETNRGTRSGEGLIGLSWAFFVAGTPRTIASQWRVESISTSELMIEFHRRLRDSSGFPVARSLQLAMNKQLSKPGRRHPFYWAGFISVGRN